MRITRYDLKRGVYNEYLSWSHGYDLQTITNDYMIEVVAETTYMGKRILIQIKHIRSKKGIDWIETKLITIIGDRAEKAYNKIGEFFKHFKLGDQNAQDYQVTN